mgnify:CR=1 FL=1
MKCFYHVDHVDQDGIVSGFYVRKACEQRGLAFEKLRLAVPLGLADG